MAPIHPEYFDLPKPARDIEGAKRLMAEAGYENGLDLTIDVGNTNGPWQQNACELLKQQVADIGVNLTLNVMPSSKYWELWTETPFGITAWTHRPLGTMVLSLGYRSGVPWNETSYSNPEFDAMHDECRVTIDEERQVELFRAMMELVVVTDVAEIPVVNRRSLAAKHNKIQGFTESPWADQPVWDLKNWTLDG